ncbi:MAG: caspase family protein [Clostridia bacterium]|nr:caspase family protein [Clostridia bacterium]
MPRLSRRLVVFLALLCAVLCISPPPARAADSKIHALLIAGEVFLQLTSLAPTTSNNVHTLTEVLGMYGDTVASLYTAIDQIGNQEQLRELIHAAFQNAGPQDICLLYISTHGRFRPAAPEYPAVITLTDGQTEFEIDGMALQAMLDDMPGTKVVLIDACNSGAMMGKGVTPNLNDQPELPFRRGDYKVLTSAGGNELSWNWSETEQDRPISLGSSYFAKALAAGLGLHGQYGADLNQDGEITLNEIYRYLLDNHGSSTVHVYPQDDDLVLFRYDPRAPHAQQPGGRLSAISFSCDTLTVEDPYIDFEFTVHQPVRLQYQLVYSKKGAWDWDGADRLLDRHEPPPGSVVSDGTVQPGRKHRSIEVSGIEADTSGYALLLIMALGEQGPEVYFSKLLAVLPTEGDPEMSVETFGEQFSLAPVEELAVQVAHRFPLQLTVSVYDGQGQRVRRLATDRTSRPLHLRPEGSLFYWNGLDGQGNRVPPGTYTIRAFAYVGGERHEAEVAIDLLD